jgi:hypothetical protein
LSVRGSDGFDGYSHKVRDYANAVRLMTITTRTGSELESPTVASIARDDPNNLVMLLDVANMGKARAWALGEL